jgi:hypothetical protein
MLVESGVTGLLLFSAVSLRLIVSFLGVCVCISSLNSSQACLWLVVSFLEVCVYSFSQQLTSLSSRIEHAPMIVRACVAMRDSASSPCLENSLLLRPHILLALAEVIRVDFGIQYRM